MRLNRIEVGGGAPGQLARSPRRRVILSGMLESVTGIQKVAVRNLSCTGAMIEGTTVPPAGREVILKAGPLDCFGRVVWTEGNRCGLHFDEPIEMSDVLALHRITAEAVEQASQQEAAEWFLGGGIHARM